LVRRPASELRAAPAAWRAGRGVAEHLDVAGIAVRESFAAKAGFKSYVVEK
jgi:hypothetical protein